MYLYCYPVSFYCAERNLFGFVFTVTNVVLVTYHDRQIEAAVSNN